MRTLRQQLAGATTTARPNAGQWGWLELCASARCSRAATEPHHSTTWCARVLVLALSTITLRRAETFWRRWGTGARRWSSLTLYSRTVERRYALCTKNNRVQLAVVVANSDEDWRNVYCYSKLQFEHFNNTKKNYIILTQLIVIITLSSPCDRCALIFSWSLYATNMRNTIVWLCCVFHTLAHINCVHCTWWRQRQWRRRRRSSAVRPCWRTQKCACA